MDPGVADAESWPSHLRLPVTDQFLHLDPDDDADVINHQAATAPHQWILVGPSAVTGTFYLFQAGAVADTMIESVIAATPPTLLVDAADDWMAAMIEHAAELQAGTLHAVVTERGRPRLVAATPARPRYEHRPETEAPPPRPGSAARFDSARPLPRWLDGAESQGPTYTVTTDADTADPVTADDEPTTLLQYLRASTASEVGVGKEDELRVDLSASALAPQGGNDALATAMAEVGGDLTLLASATGGAVLIDDGVVPVQAQPEGGSISRTFAYRATMPGIGRLTVELRQSATLLATVTLAVVATAGPDPDSPPATGSATADVAGPAWSGSLLGIHLDGDQHLNYRLNIPAGGLWTNERAPVPDPGYATRLLKEFEQIRGTRLPNQGHLQAELLNLGRLITDLLPTGTRSYLWEHRDDIYGLELQTSSATWPWELCCVISGANDLPADRVFLAERGMIRTLGEHHHPDIIAHGFDRFVVAPGYANLPGMALRAPVDEAAMLEADFGFAPGPTGLAQLTGMVNSGGFSALHFAGHSMLSGATRMPMLVLDNSTLDRANNTVKGGLSPRHLLPGVMKPDAPLVFLNACTTGGQYGPSPQQTAPQGLPHEFMRAGAGAVIGTLWEVEDDPAAEFARRFYTAFFDQAATLSQAAAAARLAAQEAATGWSPSPLAYTVYGRPTARAAT